MFMDEGLDTGDILLMDRIPIKPEDTGGSLHDKLAAMAPATLESALDALGTGNAPRQPQDHSSATHCGKLTRADGRLEWFHPAVHLERVIRAYNPWPGTFCLFQQSDKALQLKIHRATALPEVGVCPMPGTVLAADSAHGLLVSTGGGTLRLEEVQLEGSKRLPIADFLRGHPLEVGLLLS